MAKVDVRLLVAASANPLGRQVFESLLLSAIRNQTSGLVVQETHVRNLRSHSYGDKRIPFGVLERGGMRTALALGDYLGGRARLVHRFDLRLPPRHGAELATAHDLPPLRFDDEGDLAPWFVEGQRNLLGIVTPTQFAADEMCTLLGTQRTWVVPYGLAEYFRDPLPASDVVLRSWGIDRPFVLHAAGATKRKNLAALAKAWTLLPPAARENLQLALAGPQDPRRNELFGHLDNVVLLGRRDPRELASVMSRARAVVVPSTYEGFGLPALEGMACGVPVVASNVSALPEVCGEAALLVEPTPEGLAEGIWRAVHDEALRARLLRDGPLRAAEFSWDKAAAAYVSIWRQLL